CFRHWLDYRARRGSAQFREGAPCPPHSRRCGEKLPLSHVLPLCPDRRHDGRIMNWEEWLAWYPRLPGVPLMNEVTRILFAIEQGDPQAAAQLWPLVYDELRKLAGAQLAREQPGQTLDVTALVHEAYLRLAGDQDQAFANRRHFFGAAAEAMRRILVEAARRKGRAKHGGGQWREHADLDALDAGAPAEELLALPNALAQFAAHDPLKARLVELRFSGGLTLAEAAACLDISLSTADRAWRYARAWLYNAMSAGDPEGKPNDP